MINESTGHLPALCISLNSNAHKQFFVINIFPFVTCTFAAVVSDIHIAGVGQSVYPLSPRARTTAGQTCVMRSSSPHAGVTYSVTRTSRPARPVNIYAINKGTFFAISHSVFRYTRTREPAPNTHHTLRTYLSNSNQCHALHFMHD